MIPWKFPRKRVENKRPVPLHIGVWLYISGTLAATSLQTRVTPFLIDTILKACRDFANRKMGWKPFRFIIWIHEVGSFHCPLFLIYLNMLKPKMTSQNQSIDGDVGLATRVVGLNYEFLAQVHCKCTKLGSLGWPTNHASPETLSFWWRSLRRCYRFPSQALSLFLYFVPTRSPRAPSGAPAMCTEAKGKSKCNERP